MRFDLWEHCIIFSQRGKNFAELRGVCQVNAFCGRVENGTSQMHCVNFGIQGETQTVSFLCHLEHNRRESGALLLLWRASAFTNLHCLDYKLLNYTGSCPLKSVCIRKLNEGDLCQSLWQLMILPSEKGFISSRMLTVKVLALVFLNLLSKGNNGKRNYQFSSIQRENSPSSAAALSHPISMGVMKK